MIYTNTNLNATGQYFWEAFPAGSGPSDRTTYMFTYVDADPRRCVYSSSPLALKGWPLAETVVVR